MTMLLPLAAVAAVFAAAAGPRACPMRMVEIDGFCIDRYEAPNIPGHPPFVFRTAQEGENFCSAHGKRLCTEAEWVRACEGPSKRPYPYGAQHRKGACNDDKTWRLVNWAKLGTYPAQEAKDHAEALNQSEPSGSRPECVSEEGVHDLTGNAAEWVVRSFPHAHNHRHVLKGCYWAGCFGGSPPSCAFVNSAHPGNFRTYEAGFRCCKDKAEER